MGRFSHTLRPRDATWQPCAPDQGAARDVRTETSQPTSLSFINANAWHDIYGHDPGRGTTPKGGIWGDPQRSSPAFLQPMTLNALASAGSWPTDSRTKLCGTRPPSSKKYPTALVNSCRQKIPRFTYRRRRGQPRRLVLLHQLRYHQRTHLWRVL